MEGTDLRRFALKDLRRQISVVFQDYARYFLTVNENIRLGDIDTPKDSPKIQEAAIKPMPIPSSGNSPTATTPPSVAGSGMVKN